MKIIKNNILIVMMITVFLMQLLAPVGCIGSTVEGAMLSPALSINIESFKNSFYVGSDAIGLDSGIAFPEDAYYVNENNFKENGSVQKLAGWIHNKFFKRFFRIKKILGFIMAGENAGRKISIATMMIMTNLTIDIYFTNIILKPAIVAGCVLSGNPLLISF